MLTFEQFMDYKAVEPLVWEAAALMVELDIDPKEYLTLFVENSWAPGAANLSTGAGQMVTGGATALQGAGQMATGAIGGAWNQGAQAVNALGNSAAGKGIKGWWQDFQSADRKIEKAATMIQKAMTDQYIQGLGPNAQTMLTQVIQELSQIAAQAKAARRAAGATPGTTPAPGSTPAPGATPGATP